MDTDVGRVPEGTGLSQAEPEEVSALSGFDPSRMAMDALQEIIDLSPRPFEGYPDDWREQVAACPECQGWAKNHPIQQGICDEHRRPVWAAERHAKFEESALGYRAKTIARDTLYAIATEARRAETSSGSVHEGAGLQGIAHA